VSVGQLDQFKDHTDLVLTEAGPHGLPIICGPDSLADPCH
ncbi:hypothetical protein N324_10527, partial [Chlamydotis macqueenii]